jgi:spore coat-associated protein N
MMKKKKMLIAAFSSVVLLCAAIGGGTYALFTSSAQNTGNTFASGTLSLSTHRNDVPVEGPMFYTGDSDAGRMGTGLWAPKDTHTRAMLIKNTGTLDAKLTDLIAIPEGTPAQQADALTFGEQAVVTVAALAAPGGVTLNADALNEVNEAADRLFKSLINGPSFLKALARNGQEAFAIAREAVLDWTYRVDNNGQTVLVSVSDAYVGSLKDLYNSGAGRDANLPNLILPAKKTMHLAYNVTFVDDTGLGFDNDSLQGKSVNFTFKNNFEQVKNN